MKIMRNLSENIIKSRSTLDVVDIISHLLLKLIHNSSINIPWYLRLYSWDPGGKRRIWTQRCSTAEKRSHYYSVTNRIMYYTHCHSPLYPGPEASSPKWWESPNCPHGQEHSEQLYRERTPRCPWLFLPIPIIPSLSIYIQMWYYPCSQCWWGRWRSHLHSPHISIFISIPSLFIPQDSIWITTS